MNFSALAGVVVGLGIAISSVTAGLAAAATCEVPLRNVLVSESECAYYETAFRMMATSRTSVNSYCIRGQFKASPSSQAVYGAQVVTSLTVHDASCSKLTPIALNPVLLSKPNCENLKKVVSMLSTTYVSIEPMCKFGQWTGADGKAKSSMVRTKMALRPRIALQ